MEALAPTGKCTNQRIYLLPSITFQKEAHWSNNSGVAIQQFPTWETLQTKLSQKVWWLSGLNVVINPTKNVTLVSNNCFTAFVMFYCRLYPSIFMGFVKFWYIRYILSITKLFRSEVLEFSMLKSIDDLMNLTCLYVWPQRLVAFQPNLLNCGGLKAWWALAFSPWQCFSLNHKEVKKTTKGSGLDLTKVFSFSQEVTYFRFSSTDTRHC